jgi:hypothetical protein
MERGKKHATIGMQRILVILDTDVTYMAARLHCSGVFSVLEIRTSNQI